MRSARFNLKKTCICIAAVGLISVALSSALANEKKCKEDYATMNSQIKQGQFIKTLNCTVWYYEWIESPGSFRFSDTTGMCSTKCREFKKECTWKVGDWGDTLNCRKF